MEQSGLSSEPLSRLEMKQQKPGKEHHCKRDTDELTTPTGTGVNRAFSTVPSRQAWQDVERYH